MNIKEAIQVLEETKVMTLIAIDTNYTANEGHRTQWKKEVEAIQTMLDKYAKIKKKCKQLIEENRGLTTCLLHDNIPKNQLANMIKTKKIYIPEYMEEFVAVEDIIEYLM